MRHQGLLAHGCAHAIFLQIALLSSAGLLARGISRSIGQRSIFVHPIKPKQDWLPGGSPTPSRKENSVAEPAQLTLRSQDHSVLETILDFRIILRLENALLTTECCQAMLPGPYHAPLGERPVRPGGGSLPRYGREGPGFSCCTSSNKCPQLQSIPGRRRRVRGATPGTPPIGSDRGDLKPARCHLMDRRRMDRAPGLNRQNRRLGSNQYSRTDISPCCEWAGVTATSIS